MGDNNEGAFFREIEFQKWGKYFLDKIFEGEPKPTTSDTLYRCVYLFRIPLPFIYRVYLDFTFDVERKDDVYIREVSLRERHLDTNNWHYIFKISSDSTDKDLVRAREDFDAIFENKNVSLPVEITRELLNKESGATEQGGASSAWHIACSSKGYTFALIG